MYTQRNSEICFPCAGIPAFESRWVYRCLWILLFYTGVVCANPSEKMIEHVKTSIARAEMGLSKLTPEALQVPGMSSPKVRHLLNNLCSLPGTSYLEIGCWKGSTLVAALTGNPMHAFAFDNWSEFLLEGESPRKDFFQNVAPFLQSGSLKFFEADCFAIDRPAQFFAHEKLQSPINIYFYDGSHLLSNQKKAFTFFNAVFDDCFIAIVDDWNWDYVQQGTKEAFDELGYRILFEQSFLTTHNGDSDTWWNGLYIAVIQSR